MNDFFARLFSGRYPLGLFFACITAFIYTPLFLIYGDGRATTFTYTAQSFALSGLLCLAALLLCCLGHKFAPKASLAIDGLLTGVALYLLIAAIFYPMHSGILDGAKTEPHKYDVHKHVILFFICVLFTLGGLYKKRMGAVFRRAVFFMGCFVLLASGYMGIKTLPFLSQEDFAAQWRSSTSLGVGRNIIVIGLDGLQGALAEKVLRDNPELAAQFDGATLFTNAVSSGTFTALSYRGTFEGKVPTGSSVAISLTDNLLVDMQGHGYAISLGEFLNRRFNGAFEEIASLQLVPGMARINDFYDDAISLSILGAKRYLPFSIRDDRRYKEFGGMSKMGEREALQTLIDSFNVDPAVGKRLLWIHSLQTHSPVRFTKEGIFSLDLTQDDFVGEIEDALSIVGPLVTKLKDLGVYDNSLVVIMSDHGAHLVGKSKALPADLQYLTTRVGPFGPATGRYDIALMVKPPHSHGQLRYSDAAVSLLDFRKTLNEFAQPGAGEKFSGIDFLDFSQSDKTREVPALRLHGPYERPRDINSADNWETANLHLPLADNYKPEAKVP